MTKKILLFIFGVISLGIVIYTWIRASSDLSLVTLSNILSAVLAPVGLMAIAQAINIRYTEDLKRLFKLSEIEDLIAKLRRTEEAQKSKEKELVELELIIKREVRRLTLENQKKTLEETIRGFKGELEEVEAALTLLEESDAVIVTEEMQRMLHRIRGHNDRNDFLDVSD